MKIRRTESFLKDYRGLSSEVRSQVDKRLAHLVENPRHPSLKLKKLRGTGKFEIRISKGYRLTFRFVDEVLELRRVGSHDIVGKEG